MLDNAENKRIIDDWGNSSMDALRRIQRKQREEEEQRHINRVIKTTAVVAGAVGGLMILKWLLK